MLPLVRGRFLHLVVLHGYQGAYREAEKLALTDQLLDAALGELGVVARLIVGDYNVEPTKIPCLAKGISAGLWVHLEAAWTCASRRQPGKTCKRLWDSTGGSRRDFMIGCPRAAAALFVRTFSILGVFLGSLCLFSVRLFGLLPGCPCLIKVLGLSLLKYRGFGVFVTIGCSF